MVEEDLTEFILVVSYPLSYFLDGYILESTISNLEYDVRENKKEIKQLKRDVEDKDSEIYNLQRQLRDAKSKGWSPFKF